jgi:hypothetical protein
MHGVYFSLAAVAILTSGFGLVWLFCPELHAWMESPRDRFVEQQRRFPKIVRSRRTPAQAVAKTRSRVRPDRANTVEVLRLPADSQT